MHSYFLARELKQKRKNTALPYSAVWYISRSDWKQIFECFPASCVIPPIPYERLGVAACLAGVAHRY